MASSEAPVSKTGDSRFESWVPRWLYRAQPCIAERICALGRRELWTAQHRTRPHQEGLTGAQVARGQALVNAVSLGWGHPRVRSWASSNGARFLASAQSLSNSDHGPDESQGGRAISGPRSTRSSASQQAARTTHWVPMRSHFDAPLVRAVGCSAAQGIGAPLPGALADPLRPPL